MALTEIPIELSSTPSIVDGGNATAITISSAELVTVANGLTLTDGNVVVANGHGIDFAAQTAAAASGSSTGDELLDHYETGTWTMGIATGGSPNITISNTTGRYTRVGELVTVGIYTSGINVVNAGSGTISITGLPFNVRSAGGNSNYTAASFAHTDLFSSTYEAYPAVGESFARVTRVGSIADAVIGTGNPKYMMFSLTYFAA
jgi:hypothetical protein